jgi:hypothetical protein
MLKKPYRWDMKKAFVDACERAGLEDVHIHDLRHLGPSILLAQGVCDSVVAKVTGHRSSALKRYQHLSESFPKQTVELIAAILIDQHSARSHLERSHLCAVSVAPVSSPAFSRLGHCRATRDGGTSDDCRPKPTHPKDSGE